MSNTSATSSTSIGLDALCSLFLRVPRLALSFIVVAPDRAVFLAPLGCSPRYMDRRKSPSSLSYQQARSLTRAQPSSCALVTYGSRVTNPSASYSSVRRSVGWTLVRSSKPREPLAWGTRRKSIILNHGVIGSNDRTTARRASFHGDSRGRAALSFVTSRRKDPALDRFSSPSSFLFPFIFLSFT